MTFVTTLLEAFCLLRLFGLPNICTQKACRQDRQPLAVLTHSSQESGYSQPFYPDLAKYGLDLGLGLCVAESPLQVQRIHDNKECILD